MIVVPELLGANMKKNFIDIVCSFLVLHVCNPPVGALPALLGDIVLACLTAEITLQGPDGD